MLKKFSKLLSLLLIILTISSISICYATDAVATSETGETTNAVATSEADTETAGNSTTDTIHYGDLYLIGNDIVLDKIVYGSVFVIGNTVEITGQIENDLYVIANTLKIDSSISNGGLVQGKIYSLANSIYFNGACSYLYSISNNIDMTYDSFVVGNAKIASINANIKSAIGRDLELLCNKISFNDDNKFAVIYGNLSYISNNEIEIPEGIVVNDIVRQSLISLHNYSIKNIVITLISAIITVLAIYIILKKVTPKFTEKLNNEKISALKLLKAIGLGLASIIVVSLLAILLLVTAVGLNLALILILLYAIICLISVPTLTIIITNTLKTALKIEKTSLFCLILILVRVILYGLTLIPLAGILLGFIIKVLAIGLLIDMYLPHKKLIDEEVVVAKNQEKEN